MDAQVQALVSATLSVGSALIVAYFVFKRLWPREENGDPISTGRKWLAFAVLGVIVSSLPRGISGLIMRDDTFAVFKSIVGVLFGSLIWGGIAFAIGYSIERWKLRNKPDVQDDEAQNEPPQHGAKSGAYQVTPIPKDTRSGPAMDKGGKVYQKRKRAAIAGLLVIATIFLYAYLINGDGISTSQSHNATIYQAPQDEENARKLYSRYYRGDIGALGDLEAMAHRGDRFAQFYLGAIRSKKNLPEGLYWIEKSADQEYWQAQFLISLHYYDLKNYEAAYKWQLISLRCAPSYEIKTLLGTYFNDVLAPELSSEQIASAKREASEWIKRHAKYK